MVGLRHIQLDLCRDLAVHFQLHVVADSSFASYSKHVDVRRCWTTARAINPWPHGFDLGTQHDIVSAFILHGTHRGFTSNSPVRASTMTAYLAGIAHFFRAHGLSFPSGHPQITLLLKGIGRSDPAAQAKHPVSLNILSHIHAGLDLLAPDAQALWRSLCVAFYFLLRRFEIVAGDGLRYRWFCLKAQDIRVEDKNDIETTNPHAAESVGIHATRRQKSPVWAIFDALAKEIRPFIPVSSPRRSTSGPSSWQHLPRAPSKHLPKATQPPVNHHNQGDYLSATQRCALSGPKSQVILTSLHTVRRSNLHVQVRREPSHH